MSDSSLSRRKQNTVVRKHRQSLLRTHERDGVQPVITQKILYAYRTWKFFCHNLIIFGSENHCYSTSGALVLFHKFHNICDLVCAIIIGKQALSERPT